LDKTELTVYFDFLCPWAYRGAVWLDDVARTGRIRVNWRFFSLSENTRRREGLEKVAVWETSPQANGLPAFRAALAARPQGEDAYNRFRMALQKARHEEHLRVDEPATHEKVAERSGLDVARWRQDLATVDLSQLAAEHSEAVRKGVFGVPTLIWPEGRSYYIKITNLVPTPRAVELYDAIELVHRFGEVVEIKTPESEGTLAA
jgi:predicted DsbA family dithiol-disulfide isomerase